MANLFSWLARPPMRGFVYKDEGIKYEIEFRQGSEILNPSKSPSTCTPVPIKRFIENRDSLNCIVNAAHA